MLHGGNATAGVHVHLFRYVIDTQNPKWVIRDGIQVFTGKWVDQGPMGVERPCDIFSILCICFFIIWPWLWIVRSHRRSDIYICIQMIHILIVLIEIRILLWQIILMQHHHAIYMSNDTLECKLHNYAVSASHRKPDGEEVLEDIRGWLVLENMLICLYSSLLCEYYFIISILRIYT